MSVATYSIRLNRVAKTLNIAVGDKMTLIEAQNFVKEYKQAVSGIDAKLYTLHVDCTNMKVLSPEMTESLSSVMALYKETGFGKIICKIQNDAILKMQLSRLLRNAGLTNVEIVIE